MFEIKQTYSKYFLINTFFCKYDTELAVNIYAPLMLKNISVLVLLFNNLNAYFQLLTKLNTVHLTLNEHSKRNLINLYGEEAEERILKAVSAGNDGKLNGDNLDIR